MSSPSNRLRALQVPTVATLESLDHLRLEDLQEEVIPFGTKHNGHTYAEAWMDQEWVHFMLTRYQNSIKESHRRFLKFVELKIIEMESAQTVLPRQQGQNGGSRMASRPKATAKPQAAPSHISLQDGDEDWDVESEMFIPVTTGYAVNPMAEDVAALQSRMLNMENALTRVIRHIEDQAIQTKDRTEHETA